MAMEFATDAELTYYPLSSIEDHGTCEPFEANLRPNQLPYDESKPCVDVMESGRGVIARVHEGNPGWDELKAACDAGTYAQGAGLLKLQVENVRHDNPFDNSYVFTEAE